MTRCNGSCSERRAAREAGTRAGRVDHSAGRERRCCDACMSTVERSISMLLPDSRTYPTGTPIGITQTWTFMERTMH